MRIQPIMLDEAARTAQQAADALGIHVGQIAKSIIFKRKPDEAAVLVITSGDRRVDEKKVQTLVCPTGYRLGRADADFVKMSDRLLNWRCFPGGSCRVAHDID
jgi:prolyl-tRNA editing enzyme YbaK/EbsC (Cys-tRNA(Pro) deacylase)